MRNKWKIGKWTEDIDDWLNIKNLRIKGTSIAIGLAFPDYRDKTKTVVIARLSNIKSKHREIVNKPIDAMTDDELTTAWEKSFKSINDKLLK